MSNFHAAIESIEQASEYGGYWEIHKKELKAAIRFLEAAAKVNRTDALIAIDDVNHPDDCINEPTTMERLGIRDLIFALPEDEE